MNIEQTVAQHYAHGSLEQAILEALAAAGKDVDHLTQSDLAPVDEFHIGGRPATVEFASQFSAHRGMRLLDVGCGLGGAARYFAHEYGCDVTGIDLSEEYVAVANALAERVGLGGLVHFQQSSALALPFAPGSFDAAYLLHVGMNIEDKCALFAGIRRTLTPSGKLGIYDVMRVNPGDLSYPMPWATGADASFVTDAPAYRRALVEAGFEVIVERNRRDFALETFRQMRARAASGKPAPLVGIHIVMGENAGKKVSNMMHDVESDLIAPIEMICRPAP